MIFSIKANESLQAAKISLENKLYNDAVSRAYYACFQTACVALDRHKIISIGDVRNHNHKSINGLFVKRLINEEQVYSSDMRDCLNELLSARITADYEPYATLSAEKAKKCVESATYFCEIMSATYFCEIIKEPL
jgi:uncharacterized protein (UPF0332 family)